MEFTHPASAKAFLALTRASLEKREAENGLILGVCMRQALYDESMDATWYLVGKEADEIKCAAIKSEGHNLLLHFELGEEVEQGKAIARYVAALDFKFPGVFGPKEGVEAFVAEWESISGERIPFSSGMRTFRLDEIEHMGSAPGSMRMAKIPDTRLVTEWFIAFYAESMPDQHWPEEFLRQDIQRRIGNEEVYLWEKEGLVAMACSNRPTHHGISIGYVYTPPAQRKNGYATSLVAHLSKLLLEEHQYKFCTLFTDLANPTSNAIYQKIGYKALADFVLHLRGS